MAGKLVQLQPGETPVWDVNGDGGSGGYISAIAVISVALPGKIVIRPGTTTPVYDIAGDGSQGYIPVVASVN